ncbi:TetR/AcrR family transcriptional regulator [Flavobacterium sp. ARAG 55.4]|uniref:TetR/AcrR family transcriptional regulator n=1 Tax=Flavobacterium sp. ARAG 55.4 TaxID=3451357 RepID=UPI003F48031C
MKNTQQEIMKTALLLFPNNGIKKTSIDLISKKCGISKKTFYQYFIDKEDIVKKITTIELTKVEKYIENLASEYNNPPDELLIFFNFIQNNISVFTSVFINDIIEYYPKVYQIVIKSKKDKFTPFLLLNIVRGIQDGFYWETLKPKLLVDLYMLQIDTIIENTRKEFSDKREILNCTNMLFLHGIIDTSRKEKL